MSFSNSGAGGTLTLPSPTHPNHIDVQAAVRSLRRSISRSPSKFSLSRSASQSSDVSVASTQSRNPPSPASPSPASPSLRRMASQQLFGTANNAHTPTTNSILSGPSQSHLATPFRPNVKLSLRSAKSSAKGSPSAASKSSLRYRTSPKSPSKRALNSIPPSVTNSVPSPSSDSDSAGQENLFRIRSPAPRRSFERSKSRHSMHLDMSGASLQAATRVHDGNIAPSSSLSPRKRGDATLDMDQSSFGSPKAKRRSYGPSNLGGEFNVFDQGPKSPSPNFDIHDESSREYGWTGAGDQSPPEVGHASPAQVHVPRRAGSLRQSTLKQRERTSWGKRQAAMKLQEFNSSGAATPAANLKGRPRLSLDHYLPPSRDSPFNAPGPLSNASAQPHPLSRTMTTSSSNSSIPDDSPSHFAIRISEKPRAPMNWSKSLPIGAVRPTADDDTFNLGSVSTPDYKSAKPFFGAFASTGLVSKMNRNPELEPLRGHGAAAVPDTPCKKQFNAFATYPPPPGSAIKGRGKHIRHTFGAPSTPFNPMASRSDNQTTFGPRPGLFSDFGNRHARKGSLLSLYSDDGRSPIDQAGDSFMTSEADIPPTPTKQQLLEESTTPIDSPSAKRHLPAPTSAVGLNLWQDEADIASEFTPSKGSCSNKLGASGVAVRCTSDSARPIAPATTPSLVSVSVRSFGHNRAKRGSALTPLPLATLKTAALTEKPPRKAEYAKRLPLFPASPLDKLEFEESTSPKTPLEAVPTLDASRLSISNHNHKLLFPASSGRRSLFPPATPTTRHEAFPLFGDRRAITPTNGLGGHEVDAALVSRFGRVEYLGQGEFSQVFKVVKTDRTTTPTYTPSYSTPTHHTPPSPAPNDVFAVKKLKLPFKGTIDRAMRMREVAALEAMRGAEHILQLIDSWEEHNSLYIQTEYCEEGTLNTFLAKVGAKGRLDDFRIWKILSELAQGVQSIHNAGFVHLDLKPANVLINFEGTLKIGDFGMAAALPVEKGPDFEGDREYLALEVLRGEIDKPADIFSLGLIMLEIAANVKLPDNGATWTALRKGDFSEVPLLTQEANPVLRDATGMPIDESDRVSSSDEGGSGKPSRRNFGYRSAGNLFGLSKKTELLEPPNFMQDPEDVSSLDTVVQWLLTAEPVYRPTISQVLELPALHWVTSRQRAGATVYEGNWGPSDESLEPRTPITLEASPSADTEMTDV